MSEKRFKLSKYVTPSSVSNFLDDNGKMLNKEVVAMLNDRDRQQEMNVKLFFKCKEQQATIEQKDKEIKGLEEKIQRIYVNVCSAMSEVIDDE